MRVTTGRGGLSFLEAHHPAMLTGPLGSRMAAPAAAVSLQDSRSVLLVTEYEQARKFLTDSRWRRDVAVAHKPVGPASAISVTEMDPPRHTFVRGLVGRMFSPRALQLLRFRIERRAVDLANTMVSAGPPADLVTCFCAPFTFAVQCDVLGVPVHARDSIHDLSMMRSGRSDATAQETYEAEVALHREVSKALSYIRRRGGDGPVCRERPFGPRVCQR